MTVQAPSDAGFTLIEALVAMAVLALGAVSLLSAAEGNTKHIGEVSDRVTARWAADYALAARRLGLGDTLPPTIDMLGNAFVVEDDTFETADPDLSRVSFRVHKAGEERILYVLDAYLDTAGEEP